VGYPRSIGGVKVAVLLREDEPGRVKASLRAKGEVPVNAIAHRFGGGGHENAAGCTLSGTLAEATAEPLVAGKAALGTGRSAGGARPAPGCCPSTRARASPRSRSWRSSAEPSAPPRSGMAAPSIPQPPGSCPS